MFLICFAFSLLALTQGASIVPVQSSQVDVRRSGAEFSYNIQENHGVAAIMDPVPIVQPLFKTVHLEKKTSTVEQEKNTVEEHNQVHPEQKVEARADSHLKEVKKPDEIAFVAQPILTSPLEYYAYYYPYSGYSIPTLPAASLIPSVPTFAGIPFPNTLIKTV